jgi:D-aminopeptidase
MKKQIFLYADMEGASGIFERNADWCYNGGDNWRKYGKNCITSDVKAVCEACVASGIDEVLLYDGHFAGNPEGNILYEQLPSIVRLVDTPDRCFIWPRIRGQAEWEPYGFISVGQHARAGTENAYFPHSIHTPPIKRWTLNGKEVGEIGMAAYMFCRAPYIANIGDKASMREALEICPTVSCISVKDKENGWEPEPSEIYSAIKQGVIDAIKDIAHKEIIEIEEPCVSTYELCSGYYFEQPEHITWKGEFLGNKAIWEAPDVETAISLFQYIEKCVRSEK